MMKLNRSMSAIIPIYNEEALLESSFREIHRFLDETFSEFEILAIESGSTDQSAAILDRLANEFPRLRVIHEGQRRGLGAAVRLGFESVQKDYVYLQPIDQCFPLSYIASAVQEIDRYDAVLSFRSTDPRTLYRRLQSSVFNALARHLLGLEFRNINSALKVYRRDVIQSLDLTEKGWLIDLEIVCQLRERGMRYCELPVPFVDRSAGQSSIRFSTGVRVFLELLRFSKRRKTARSSPSPGLDSGY